MNTMKFTIERAITHSLRDGVHKLEFRGIMGHCLHTDLKMLNYMLVFVPLPNSRPLSWTV